MMLTIKYYDIELLVYEFTISRISNSQKKKLIENISIIKQNIDDVIGLTNIEWEFPKGRKNENEFDFNCAIREFKEETNIELSNINTSSRTMLKESYIGLNKLNYRNVFYIIESEIMFNIKKDKENIIRPFSVSSEVSDLKWVSVSQIDDINCKESYKKILKLISSKIQKESQLNLCYYI